MIPAVLPTREFTQGNTFRRVLVFSQNVNGVLQPLNLTTFLDIRMDLRKGPNEKSELVKTFLIGDGLLITGVGLNHLVMDFRVVTNTIAPGSYFFDLPFTAALNEEQTKIKGQVNVLSRITKKAPVTP